MKVQENWWGESALLPGAGDQERDTGVLLVIYIYNDGDGDDRAGGPVQWRHLLQQPAELPVRTQDTEAGQGL